jgi:thioredoxin-dependent peroxiredoxin
VEFYLYSGRLRNKEAAMFNKFIKHFLLLMLLTAICSCAASRQDIKVEKISVEPGSQVTFKGTEHKLLGTPVAVGEKIPPTRLVDSLTFQETDLSDMKGEVLFISIVPSVDTKVCEAQTHYLGEEGDRLPSGVKRITVSRDLPFDHKRFAQEAKLTDIQYLSDYKTGEFGRSMGLLVDELMLLARSVIIVDHEGIIRYIQVVPEMTHLPDMESAFNKAERLVN